MTKSHLLVAVALVCSFFMGFGGGWAGGRAHLRYRFQYELMKSLNQFKAGQMAPPKPVFPTEM